MREKGKIIKRTFLILFLPKLLAMLKRQADQLLKNWLQKYFLKNHLINLQKILISSSTVHLFLTHTHIDKEIVQLYSQEVRILNLKINI